MDVMSPVTRRLLFKSSFADMQKAADKMRSSDRAECSHQLQAVALNAIWKSAYLESRYGSGFGDQGHDAAVKAANRELIKTRKAMGFTCPERGAVRV